MIAPPRQTEWEPPGPAPKPAGRLLLAALLAVPVGAAIGAAVAVGGYTIWLAAGAVLICIGWVLVQRRLLLARATPARTDEDSRFANIAQGLSADLGCPTPRLFISSSPGPNAFVIPGALVVTRDLYASYTLTELEAVIAHCLVRLRDGGLGWAVVAAALGGAGGRATPRVDRYVDARAAEVTRYPPALASAIDKASPARGHAAGLWFVAETPSHAPVEERVAELLDL